MSGRLSVPSVCRTSFSVFRELVSHARAGLHTLPNTGSVSYKKSGLTLIEVMLSIVILGIGSGALMLATARCLSVVSKARHYSNAQRLVLRVGAENPLSRGELRDETESGDFDDGYTWEREVIESEDENREGLYTVRTRVSWSTRGKEQFEEIVTWHYIEPEEK